MLDISFIGPSVIRRLFKNTTSPKKKKVFLGRGGGGGGFCSCEPQNFEQTRNLKINKKKIMETLIKGRKQ